MEQSELTSNISSLSPQAGAFNRLYELVNRLTGQQGCPWDKQQTPESMRGPLIEELFEVIDAIDSKDVSHIEEELGDCFFNLMLTSLLFTKENSSSIDQIINSVCNKIVNRHPHVFTELNLNTDGMDWDTIKRNIENRKSDSVLDEVPSGFPPLLKAYKYLKKASKAGFDWRTPQQVEQKVQEEFEEVKQAATENNPSHLEEELGDLMLSVINLCRYYNVNPETALNQANNKFYKRFTYVEKTMAQNNLKMQKENDPQMMNFWKEAKEAKK